MQGFKLEYIIITSMSLILEQQEKEQKVQHLASDILINATEKQCSGVRCREVDGEKSYCALGLLNLYA